MISIQAPRSDSINTRQSVRDLLVSADTWLLIGLGALAIVFFTMTFDYRPAAALFPRIVTVIVAALCVYELGMSLRAALAGQFAVREQSEEAARGLRWHQALLAIVAYSALIYVLGFDLATLAFLIGFPPLTGYRRWVIIVIVAVASTVLVEISFARFLHVPLPKGWLPSWLGW